MAQLRRAEQSSRRVKSAAAISRASDAARRQAMDRFAQEQSEARSSVTKQLRELYSVVDRDWWRKVHGTAPPIERGPDARPLTPLGTRSKADA